MFLAHLTNNLFLLMSRCCKVWGESHIKKQNGSKSVHTQCNHGDFIGHPCTYFACDFFRFCQSFTFPSFLFLSVSLRPFAWVYPTITPISHMPFAYQHLTQRTRTQTLDTEDSNPAGLLLQTASRHQTIIRQLRGRRQLPAFCFKQTMFVWEGGGGELKLVRLEENSAFLDCCVWFRMASWSFRWRRHPQYYKLCSRGGLHHVHGQARICRRLLQSWLATFMISRRR